MEKGWVYYLTGSLEVHTKMPQKYSIKVMHQLASKYGSQCLSAGYIYSKTSLISQCTDGHPSYEVTFHNLDDTVE